MNCALRLNGTSGLFIAASWKLELELDTAKFGFVTNKLEPAVNTLSNDLSSFLRNSTKNAGRPRQRVKWLDEEKGVMKGRRTATVPSANPKKLMDECEELLAK